MIASRLGRAAVTFVAAVAVAPTMLGAAAAPAPASGAVRPAEFCIPILLPCDEPTPTPSPTPTDAPSLPGLPGAPEPSASATPTPGPSATPPASVDPIADDGAPVFTQPSAQLGSQSLSFSGLKGISVVTVPLADGSRTTALKLEADRISIDGFSLTVRHEVGPVLTTTADTMTLDGHVAVYVNSLSATLPGGQTLTLGPDTPPPAEGLDSLLRVTLGLVGSTADSITYTNTVQHLEG